MDGLLLPARVVSFGSGHGIVPGTDGRGVGPFSPSHAYRYHEPMTISHWRFSPGPETVHVDAVVIGAGICGIAAALAFERRGLRVAVVERGTIASGASGRNAGFLMRGAADHYADAIRLYGRERARVVWKWTEDNLADLRREGIEELSTYRRVPSALLALNEKQEGELRRAAELLKEDGFEVEWASEGDDSIFGNRGREGNGVLGALVNPNDASVNPVEMVRFLARKLKGAVYENETVLDIAQYTAHSTHERGLVAVRTPVRTFVAPRVLLATNAYTPLLIPSLSALVTPRRGQMFALRNTPDAAGRRPLRLAHSYYANYGSEYLRQTADGTVVIGGCRTYFAGREIGYEDVTTDWVQRALESFASRLLGPAFSAADITTRWSGVMGFSPDGLPLVGPLPEFPAGNVWFCGAFTGHGMSMGFRTAGAAVAGMIEGTKSPFEMGRCVAPAVDRGVGP